ncbi:MAG: PIN domain-containing protein [Dehalococcoidia bacterium]
MSIAFADAHYWIAMLNPRDPRRPAIETFEARVDHPELVTTEEVLVEVLAFYSGRGARFRIVAAELVRDLLADSSVQVIHQSHESFLRGLDLYERRGDKRYSLVDCVSMAVMREHGIIDVLSGDQHFRQEGFVPLIDPDAP